MRALTAFALGALLGGGAVWLASGPPDPASDVPAASGAAGTDGKPRPSRNLGEGKRAVTIMADTSVGVAGFVAPGDRVDIMLTREIDGSTMRSRVMADVPVLAVEPRLPVEPGADWPLRTVIVEVPLSAAQKLALAQQIGRLSLTLRAFDDAEPRVRRRQVRPRNLPKRCERPWSGYPDIPEDILRPNLCRSSLDNDFVPSPGPLGTAGPRPVR